MDPAISRIEQEFMLIGRHQAALTKHPDQLDRSAITLLACLDAGGPMSIGELASTLGLDASTLNRQTSALRGQGLADRIPDPDGGIARKFQISAEGRRRLRDEHAANQAALVRVLQGWDAADVRTFADLLERFNTDIEERSGRRWRRRPVRRGS